MANPDSLSPAQLDKVMEFQEISGCTDVCVCVNALHAANWEVEVAVHKHLTDASSDVNNSNSPVTVNGNNSSTEPEASLRRRENTTQPSASSSQNSSEASSSNSVTRSPQIASVQNQVGIFRRILRMAAYIGFHIPTQVFIRWPMRLSYYVLSSMFNFVNALVFTPSNTSEEDVLSFISQYSSNYPGVAHPDMMHCSYKTAVATAKNNLQFLLVYLHCKDNNNTEHFCRNVLSDDRVRTFITSNNILFWACDITLSEGYRASAILQESTYPFLALIVSQNNRMNVAARMEGRNVATPERFLTYLKNKHEVNIRFIVAAQAKQAQLAENSALRVEQDYAYEESLRRDREKARVKREQKMKEEEERMREERCEQRKRDRIERLKQLVKEDLSPSTPNSLTVAIKFPSGERESRTFSLSDPSYLLYCFIISHSACPKRYELYTSGFPRTQVSISPPEWEESDLSVEDAESQTPQGPLHEPLDPSHPGYIKFSDIGIPQRSLLLIKDLDA